MDEKPFKEKDRTVDYKVTEYRVFPDACGFRFHIEIKL